MSVDFLPSNNYSHHNKGRKRRTSVDSLPTQQFNDVEYEDMQFDETNSNRWAGGSFSNSPAPSSLPLPSWIQKRSPEKLGGAAASNNLSSSAGASSHQQQQTQSQTDQQQQQQESSQNSVEEPEEDLDKKLEEAGFFLSSNFTPKHHNHKNKQQQSSKKNKNFNSLPANVVTSNGYNGQNNYNHRHKNKPNYHQYTNSNFK